MHRTAALPRLDDVDPDDVVDEYHRRGLDRLSDDALVEAVSTTVSVPRVEEADSFVLHAPLEILARAMLLRAVAPAARERARMRLVHVAARLAAWGTPVKLPTARLPLDPRTATGQLRAAIAAGELDDAAVAARCLAEQLDTPDLVRAVAPIVLPSLAAAAHAPIFLYLLPRVAPRTRAPAWMLASTARELARHPDWRLRWQECPELDQPATRRLTDTLWNVRRIGSPGVNFIQPLMNQAESSGVAAETLVDSLDPSSDVAITANEFARVAAWSMLQDDADQSPYGWSHALTMPQAAANMARHHPRPHEALAIAGTHLVGFRTGLGTLDIVATVPDSHNTTVDDVIDSLDRTPHDAGAAALALTVDAHPALATALATEAACHHDAHLAKYVNACFDAARADRPAASLYLAAASHLTAWWRQLPAPDDDPISID